MSLDALKKVTDTIGHIYGTDDFPIYVYSLIKMQKLETLVEYGTGLGATALWCGQALKENGHGKIYTIDNGYDWPANITRPELARYKELEYKDYIKGAIDDFGLAPYIDFYKEIIDVNKKYTDKALDLVFSDYNHTPDNVLRSLTALIPRMAENSYIFIDGASCFLPTYWMLKELISMLNAGKIPKAMREESENTKALIAKIRTSTFSITDIIEAKNRKQNNTLCLSIRPIDIFPYDRSFMTT